MVDLILNYKRSVSCQHQLNVGAETRSSIEHAQVSQGKRQVDLLESTALRSGSTFISVTAGIRENAHTSRANLTINGESKGLNGRLDLNGL